MDGLCILLFQLLALDDDFDIFFVPASQLIIAPPLWSLIFALEPEMLACSTPRRALVAILSS
jgi:hypothetical protein